MIKVIMILSGLLLAGQVRAEGEMVQCGDQKGDPVIYRKGECQTLDDPTVPPGYQPKAQGNDATRLALEEVKKKLQEVEGQAAGMERLRKEFDLVKKQLDEVKDVGRYEVNTTKDIEVETPGVPGPWMVKQTLVPAEGEDGKNFKKIAVINGYRYHQGERADGGVVKEIARDRVVMVHEGKETVVPFGKETHATVFGRVGSVPLRKDESGIYYVKLRLNHNQEIEAVVDTGASMFSVPEDIVAWLRRSGTLKPEDFLGSGKLTIADGSSKDTKVFKIRSLRIGDMELKDLEGNEVPMQQDKKTEGQGDKKSTDDKKLIKSLDLAQLNQPLFGINGLKMLGKWRIDHFNNLLIVER